MQISDLTIANKKVGLYKLFWIFFVGCFFGVFVETIYYIVKTGAYENRVGVIYGPFNPVYGFGALVMTLVLNKIRNKSDIQIFVSSMIIGGSFEYLCSWIQELSVGTVSWQYAGAQISIGGRTSLVYMIFWGFLGYQWLKRIYPFMSKVIDNIPRKIIYPLTIVLAIFMILNMSISLIAVRRQTSRNVGHVASNKFEEFIDKTYNDQYLSKIYPNMVSKKAVNVVG